MGSPCFAPRLARPIGRGQGGLPQKRLDRSPVAEDRLTLLLAVGRGLTLLLLLSWGRGAALLRGDGRVCHGFVPIAKDRLATVRSLKF
ncbi:hypothetical protein EGN72_02880 [Pseudorhodobacter sp. E13]|nr:hypothetical protein EGN72_02880 [Pseudorhodobacter sp. E13]